MDEQLPVQEIESRAAAIGASLNEVCRRAGGARSTYTRWKSGETQPNYRLLTRMLDALSDMEIAVKRDLQEAS